jgi:antitoxin (DNA-binding transcriptional repressor) of toxin-antitoxin stability system
MYICFMAVMTVSEARAALPEVLNRVAAGEEVTITRHGQPIAVVVRPDVMWSRSRAEVVLGEADRLHSLLSAAADTRLPLSQGGIVNDIVNDTAGDMTGNTAAGTGLSIEYAEELVAAIRADRDSR